MSKTTEQLVRLQPFYLLLVLQAGTLLGEILAIQLFRFTLLMLEV